MAAAKRDGRGLDPELSGVQDEVLEFDNRRRLVIPLPFLQRLPWFNERGAVALAILREEGKISLISWELSGAIVERRAELIAQRSTDELRLLEDRYRRISIDGSGRIKLPSVAELHLVRGDLQIIAYGFPDRIELWSASCRFRHLADEPAGLSDLP